jgi:hypothetical protein
MAAPPPLVVSAAAGSMERVAATARLVFDGENESAG